MRETKNSRANAVRGRPQGGYRPIGVAELSLAWSVYRQGLVTFRDLRVVFALHEMASRRDATAGRRHARYTVDEITTIVGGAGGRHVRASLNRLQRVGVATCDGRVIAFADSSDGTGVETAAFLTGVALIANRKRRVPVPRRTLRMLARATRPAVVATVLGHLFRCVYAKGLSVAVEGSVSSTWVAETFGIDPRNVKRAKAELTATGWLCPLPSDHWHRQRYGGRARVNVDWKPMSEASERLACKTPPRPPVTVTGSPPPDTNRELLNGFKNQKPAAVGRAGVRIESPSPRLHAIVAVDFTDAHRLLNLFRQAVERRLVQDSECDRLRFVTAAVHAARKATRNPGGFLSRVVRSGLWHHASADDEAIGRAILVRSVRSTNRIFPCLPGLTARGFCLLGRGYPLESVWRGATL